MKTLGQKLFQPQSGSLAAWKQLLWCSDWSQHPGQARVAGLAWWIFLHVQDGCIGSDNPSVSPPDIVILGPEEPAGLAYPVGFLSLGLELVSSEDKNCEVVSFLTIILHQTQ